MSYEINLKKYNAQLRFFGDRTIKPSELQLIEKALATLEKSDSPQAKELFKKLRSNPNQIQIIINEQGAQLASMKSPMITIDLVNRPYFTNRKNQSLVQASIARLVGHELSHIILNTQDINFYDYDIIDVNQAHSVSAVGFMDSLMQDLTGIHSGDHSNIIKNK